MLRGILSAIVILAISLLAATSLLLANNARDGVRETVLGDASSARNAILSAERLGEVGVIEDAIQFANDVDVVAAMACPKDSDEISRNSRQAAGDDSGEEAQEGNTACPAARHALTQRELQSSVDEYARDFGGNRVRELAGQGLGNALPSKPYLVVAADATGEVVARAEFDASDYHGDRLPRMDRFPVVGRANALGPQHDVIMWRDYPDSAPIMLNVATAPVRRGGEFLGTITVGYQMGATRAAEMKSRLADEDIFYFYSAPEDDSFRVGGSSLDDGSGRQKVHANLDSIEFTPMSGNGEGEPVSFSDVINGSASHRYAFSYGGNDYFMTIGKFSDSRADVDNTAGFAIVTNWTRQAGPLAPFNLVIPIMALALIILTMRGVMFLVRAFLAPAASIVRGVQEVIAGRHDYWWPVPEGSYFADLAHALNIMSARLQGKPDPDSDDAAGQREWQGLTGQGGNGAGGNGAGGNKSIVGGFGALRKGGRSDSEQ